MDLGKWLSANLAPTLACVAVGALIVMEIQRSRDDNVLAVEPPPATAPAPARRTPTSLAPPLTNIPIPPDLSGDTQGDVPPLAIEPLRSLPPVAQKPAAPSLSQEQVDQVQQLLGAAYYPGATIDTASQVGSNDQSDWPKIVLNVPGGRTEDIARYYASQPQSMVFTDPSTGETVIARPGDGRNVHLDVVESDGVAQIIFQLETPGN